MMYLTSIIVFATICSTGTGEHLQNCHDVMQMLTCSCEHDESSDGYQIDCSDQSLPDIPHNLPVNTTHISAQRSNITVLKNISAYPKLSLLDLTQCNISNIAETAFNRTSNLRTLILRDNPLNMVNLPEKIFTPLTELKYLDTSGNLAATALRGGQLYLYKLIGTVYRDDVYAHLANVESLTLDGLPYLDIVKSNGTFGDGFHQLKKLQYLNLRGYFPHIKNETFQAFNGLPVRNLTIWSCWLTTIDSGAFSHFKELEFLDLSYNPTLSFERVRNSWPSLQYTRIKQLHLERISKFGTHLQNVTEDFFVGLEHTNLTHLSLEGNHIVQIKHVFSKYLPNLEYLSFAYNRMEPLEVVDDLTYDLSLLKNIKHIDGSRQFKRLYVSDWETLIGQYPDFSALPGRKKRSVQERIETSKTFHDAPNRKDQMRYKRNADSAFPMRNPPLPTGYSKPPLLPMAETLEYIDLSESLALAWSETPTLVISNAKSLKYFIFRNNALQKLENNISFINKTPESLTLDISENSLTAMALHNIFAPLKTIIAEHNRLGEYLLSNGREVFDVHPVLETINLSDNLIRNLPEDIFIKQTQLKLLNLSVNSIRQFSLKIDTLVQLEKLDLSTNLLSDIPASQRKILGTLSGSKNESLKLFLKLAGNPFLCSCETLEFLKWVQETRQGGSLEITDVDSCQCSFENVLTDWTNTNMQNVITKLELQCSLTKYITIGAVLVVIVILAVTTSICSRRHKWEIRYWFINNVIKRKAKRQAVAESRHITHDAFVAFHQDDIVWLKRQLLPNLEDVETGSCSLIVHHRDFLPGTIIEENIVQSIKCCRKTLLLISREFLRSNWCQFEVQMARAESFDIGRDLIVAVLLEPISVLMEDNGMTRIVQNILRKRTYIEWPESAEEQLLFWERLRQIIKKQVNEVKCECGRITSYNVLPGEGTNQDNNKNQDGQIQEHDKNDITFEKKILNDIELPKCTDQH